VILLLLAILSVNSAFQGEVVNITLSEPATVYLDSCMFFKHSLNSSEDLTAGTHEIVISYACEGYKAIVVRGLQEEKLTLEVKRLENLSEEILKMQKRLIMLEKENEILKSRVSYLQSLVEIINSINVDLYDRIRVLTETNMNLSKELDLAKSDLQNCSKNLSLMNQMMIELQKRVSDLEKMNHGLEDELNQAKEFLKNSMFYSELFKNISLLLIALLVGMLLAFIRRY